MKRYTTVRPDGVFAQLRSGTAGAVEDDEHLATLWRNLHPESGTTSVPVNYVRRGRRKHVDGTFGQLESWHGVLPSAVLPSCHIGSTANEMTGSNVILRPH